MFFCMAEYCDTLQSKEERNREHKLCLSRGTILHLLDCGCMDYPHFLQLQRCHAESIKTLNFQDSSDILLEMRLSGVTE